MEHTRNSLKLNAITTIVSSVTDNHCGLVEHVWVHVRWICKLQNTVICQKISTYYANVRWGLFLKASLGHFVGAKLLERHQVAMIGTV